MAKTVFTNNELAHQWAHKTVPNGRNSTGSFYFDGDTIYSYGGHFPIARLVEDQNGAEVVLFTNREYSVTTSGHKHRVRSSIPYDTKVFYVHNPRNTPQECLREKIASVRAKEQEVADATRRPTRVRLYNELVMAFTDAEDFAEGFGLAFDLTLREFEGIAADIEQHKLSEANRRRRVDEARAEREAERQRRWRLVPRGESRPAFGEQQQQRLEERIAQWREGANVDVYGAPDTMLRVEGDNVATSRGAEFPLVHAIRGYDLVESTRQSGQPYQRTGDHAPVRLGIYKVDRVEANGDVTAGCHFVKYEEIQRLAEAINRVRTTFSMAQVEVSVAVQ